jgi:hypothetical protein
MSSASSRGARGAVCFQSSAYVDDIDVLGMCRPHRTMGFPMGVPLALPGTMQQL